ncbi:60S ribosomal protein L32 [Myotis brandtii]|uniref:60S ribosomal protein L32 n=1 Tax=Myotis brandtii TaxID=109478 RepID=S7PC32_MYOBR|nr:60S ribosomal protein L32 [Myotis brandtii]
MTITQKEKAKSRQTPTLSDSTPDSSGIRPAGFQADLDGQHGLWSNRKTKHTLPSGVRKVPEPEVLLTCRGCPQCLPEPHTAERAAQLPRVTSPNARLCGKENEETAYVHIAFVLIKP